MPRTNNNCGGPAAARITTSEAAVAEYLAALGAEAAKDDAPTAPLSKAINCDPLGNLKPGDSDEASQAFLSPRQPAASYLSGAR